MPLFTSEIVDTRLLDDGVVIYAPRGRGSNYPFVAAFYENTVQLEHEGMLFAYKEIVRGKPFYIRDEATTNEYPTLKLAHAILGEALPHVLAAEVHRANKGKKR